MKTTGALFASLVLVLAGCFFTSSGAHGQTPKVGTPAAPANVQALGGVLSWEDTSANEEGFRITIFLRATVHVDQPSRDDLEFVYTVGAGATSFPIPSETHASCPDWASVEYSVVAFNESGSSEPVRFGPIFPLCPETTETPPPGTPTVAAPGNPQLPSTGTRGEISGIWLIAALGIGGAVLATAGVVAARRR